MGFLPMVYGSDITIVNGCENGVYKPTNSTWGPHPVVFTSDVVKVYVVANPENTTQNLHII